MAKKTSAEQNVSLDSDTREMLESHVKKGKARKFILIHRGVQIKTLIVFRKGPYRTRIQEAKKAGHKGEAVCGIVTGSGKNISFLLPGTPEAAHAMNADAPIEKEPTKTEKLKLFLKTNGFESKPSYQFVTDPDAIAQSLNSDSAAKALANDARQPTGEPPSADQAANDPPTDAAQPATTADAPLSEAGQSVLDRETDRIFYATTDFPEGEKIPSESHPMAKVWLEIRERLRAKLSGRPDPAPNGAGSQTLYPDPARVNSELREKMEDKLHEYLMKSSGLSSEEIQRLEIWTMDNYMAEEKGITQDDEQGGDRLADALNGKSDLGKLSQQQKMVLLYQFAQNWIYSPEFGEAGAVENISEFTLKIKDDPKLNTMAAAIFLDVASNIAEFEGPNYDTLSEQREIQTNLRDHAVDLDAKHVTRTLGEKNGKGLARWILGQNERKMLPGVEFTGNPDRYGGTFDAPNERRRNAVMMTVANGALDEEQATVFFDTMFRSSSQYDVSPVDSIWGTFFDYDVSTKDEQTAMAKLLSRIANARNKNNGVDAQKTFQNLRQIMYSDGGREILFSTSINTTAIEVDG